MSSGGAGIGSPAAMSGWLGKAGLALGGCIFGGFCIAGFRRMQRVTAARRQLQRLITLAIDGGVSDARVVITGASSGLGAELVRQFAQHRSVSLLLGCRDLDKAKAVVSRIATAGEPPRLVRLELLDPDSVQSFADEVHEFFQGGSEGLRLLINNAAVMRPPASEKPSSASSADMTWQVNFLAPFLLTEMVAYHRQKAKQLSPVRVVQISSRLESRSKLDSALLQAVAASQPGEHQYADSKRAGLFWISVRAQSLAFKSNMYVHASTPGMVDTDLGRHTVRPGLWPLTKPLRWLLLQSPVEGAYRAVAVGLRSQALSNFGRYYDAENELEDLVMERMGEKRLALEIVKWATTVTALEARTAGYDR
mmetsp:Transcript_28695/g.66578  ORF Transcript_28695/g.66578 Transcript_28695/m.66578 type:complete len:365 (+) Transcript_28695:92-1186(+)